MAATALTRTERDRLTELEETVQSGLQTFVEVGTALAEIRESRLYRESHDTFEAYCRERWGMSDRRARQLMSATEVVGTLSEGAKTGTTVPVPTSERVARPLTKLDPDDQKKAWERATEKSDQPTAKDVEEAVADVVPLKTKKDGTIDKLGSLKAARERDAERTASASVTPIDAKRSPDAKVKPAGPRTEKEWVDAEKKVAKQQVEDSPQGRMIDFLGHVVEHPDRFTEDEIRAALDEPDFPVHWLRAARIIHRTLGCILAIADEKEETSASA